MADAGSRLLCKLRSGTHGLNEELGRYRGREGNIGRMSCVVMSVRVSVMCCGSVQHTGEAIGNGFECFDTLDSLGKSCFILDSELLEEHFDSVLPLVKDYVVRHRKLNYVVMTHPSLNPQPGIWGFY